MLNDGTKTFDHSQDGFNTKLGGCTSFFRFLDRRTAFSLIYQKGKLTLTHAVEKEGFHEVCFSVDNLKLPESFYIGFSAATGGVSDVHDILRVTTTSLDEARSQVGGAPPVTQSHQSDHESGTHRENSGLFTFLKNLLISVILLFIVYVIWVYYQSTKTQSYKRF